MNDAAEFRHFKYLLAVAEHKGFRAAAERLNTSQPSLSKQARNDWIDAKSPSHSLNDLSMSVSFNNGTILTGRASGCAVDQEDFGTAGNGSPASPLRTRPAMKSEKGTMSSPTLARSRAFM